MADEKNNVPPQGVPGAPKAPPKSDTSRIDLSEAEAPPPKIAPHETLNIKEVVKNVPPPPAAPIKPVTATVARAIPASSPKTSTSRISLEAALTESGAMDETAKDQTIRLDLTAGPGRPPQTTVVADAQKNRTARIRIEETPAAASDTDHIAVGGGDTSHITLEPGKASKATDTDHISLTERADETSHIQLPGAPAEPPPKTIRIARPAAMPKTVTLPRAEAGAEPASATAPIAPPKTVVLKRPGEEAEADKGSTARIAVPEGIVQAGPASQRKTIRIKRPDAPTAGGKTLVIARPSRAPSVTLPASAEEQVEEAVRELKQEDTPGVAFAIMAIAATLVAAALVYVLAAQTILPSLPMPGRVL